MSSMVTGDNLIHLKAWLTRALEPISDADTEILADYVIALLKADSPEEQLEKDLREQLRDFLDNETDPFVSSFFATLKSKSYIPPPAIAASVVRAAKPIPTGPRNPGLAPKAAAAAASAVSSRPSKRSRSTSPSNSRLDDTSSNKVAKVVSSGTSQSHLSGPSSSNNAAAGGASELPPPPVAFNSNEPLTDDPGAALWGADGVTVLPGGDRSLPPQQMEFQRVPRRPLCFDYHQRGFCPRGLACQWEHDPPFNAGPPGMMGYEGGGDLFDERRGGYQPHHPAAAAGGFPGPMGMGGGPPFIAGPLGVMDGMGGMAPGPSRGGRGGGRGGGGPGRGGAPFQPYGPSGGGGFSGQSSREQLRAQNAHDASSQPPKDRSSTTLVVSEIPKASLNLPAIKAFFDKFGDVTSVAVDPRGAPRALVSFATNEQAYKAWRTEDLVLGSRFVKILWHRPIEGQGEKGKEALEKSKAKVEELKRREETKARKERAFKLEGLIARQKVLVKRLEGEGLSKQERGELMGKLREVGEEMKTAAAEREEAEAKIKAVSASASAAEGSADKMEGVEEAEGRTTSPTPTTEATTSGVTWASGELPAPSTPGAKQTRQNVELEALDRELAGRAGDHEMRTDDGNEEPSTTTELLMRKLEMMKAEATLLGIDPSNMPSSPALSSVSSPYTPRGRGRGRGGADFSIRGTPRGRGGRGGGRGGTPLAEFAGRKSIKLDFRTKVVAIKGEGLGQDEDAQRAVEGWSESMGSIESSRPDSADPDRLLVTFTSRAAAEQAMAKGHNIADLTLPVSLAWYNAPPSMGSLSGSAAASAKASPGPELQQATTGGSRRDEEMLASSQDHHHRRAGEDEDEEDEGGRRR